MKSQSQKLYYKRFARMHKKSRIHKKKVKKCFAYSKKDRFLVDTMKDEWSDSFYKLFI